MHPVELGGSIFVEANHIMMEAKKRFNLPSASSQGLAQALKMPDLGVWNGEEFVIVTTEEDGWWDKAKLLWRYGAAPLWTNRLMKSTVGKFESMYEEPVFPWRSLSDVVERVGLLGLTGVTGEQLLRENGIGEVFGREIIQARYVRSFWGEEGVLTVVSTRVNYASNLPYIHGLETMVCMATNGAMQIEGGNWQIFASMLNASFATVHLNTTVSSISKQHDSTYTLTTSDGLTSTYDDIVLAAPLQYTDLVIDPAPKHIPDEIPYAKLYTTLFASPYLLDPTAFNMGSGDTVPQFVLTTLPPREIPKDAVGSPGFFSISLHHQAYNKHATPHRLEYVYKIFSPARVNATLLSHILGHKVTDDECDDGDVNESVSWIHHKIWYSYPREYPRVTFEEIVLDDGLWYTSAIESFISTMETSALSGKNVARLIRDGWVEGKREEREREGVMKWELGNEQVLQDAL